jgi:O-antigen ligase
VNTSGRTAFYPSQADAVARLEAASFILLALVPLGMAIANRSAPALLVVAALLALSARLVRGDLSRVTARLVSTLASPVALGCLAFLAFAAVSLAWSHAPRASLAAFGELVLAAGAPLVLHAALPRPVPRWAVLLAAAAAALGCASILAELATGVSLRGSLGFRNESFIFKRSSTAILILLWPLAAFLWRDGYRLAALGIGALVLCAGLASHAGAMVLGLAAGLGALGLALLSRRLAAAGLAAALAASMGIAPVLGDAAAATLPQSLVERLRKSHAQERIDLWQSFGEVVRRRPIAGAGFGTNPRMATHPLAAEVPEDRRLLLGVGHAHNGYLQIWSETGLIGAIIALATLLALAFRLLRGPPVAFALTACAAAIITVGHGAWQGWWIATLGAAVVWLARLAPRTMGPAAGQEASGTSPSSSSVDAARPRNPVAST